MEFDAIKCRCMYCCFVDLTAAFDRVPRSFTAVGADPQERRSCGVSALDGGRLRAAIQASSFVQCSDARRSHRCQR